MAPRRTDVLARNLERTRARRRLAALPSEARQQLRKQAGLSLDVMAKAMAEAGCPVSRVAIGFWEARKHEPRGDHALAYLKVLDRLAAEALRSA